VLACDSDVSACRVFAARHGVVPHVGYICDVDYAPLALDGGVDVVTGGIPCQQFSVRGNQAGLSDWRASSSIAEMLRAVDALTPWVVVVENVRQFARNAAGDPPAACW
jgi:DNA (cytosine-5)-methyltransferase 1